MEGSVEDFLHPGLDPGLDPGVCKSFEASYDFGRSAEIVNLI
jgi:hypothetical protein